MRLLLSFGSTNGTHAYALRYYMQAVIMVIDSSDRDRLHVSAEELHRMMEHEVGWRSLCGTCMHWLLIHAAYTVHMIRV